MSATRSLATESLVSTNLSATRSEKVRNRVAGNRIVGVHPLVRNAESSDSHLSGDTAKPAETRHQCKMTPDSLQGFTLRPGQRKV